MMAFFDVIPEICLGVPALPLQKVTGIYYSAYGIMVDFFKIEIVIIISLVLQQKSGIEFL
jgi:hypothetical protein